jgi:hypothetical protein
MELNDLIGEHVLDAVDFVSENIKAEYGEYFEDCSIIRFRLDGIIYEAIEDPNDGYRSSMREIRAYVGPMVNKFPPISVIARMKPNGSEYGGSQENETLQLIDKSTGRVILEAGTDNTDDYYPYFVSYFDPKGMAVNADKG